jgi:hypothetical protein
MRSGSPDGATEILLERLHYGKLAEGRELSIPANEGYGVTRRSRGLAPDLDGVLSPPRLIGARRVEPDLIDPAARARGSLLARVLPHWPSGGVPPLALLRSRFRHEDGDDGRGRLYQQSAVWLCGFDSWRRRPDAVLELAGAQLEAKPDLCAESEALRFASPPLRALLPPPRRSASAAVTFALDVLVRYALLDDGCVVTFGAGCEFRDEAQFLAAIGAALRQLPPNYPRWRDISVMSGLRNDLPGICFRFLPSYGLARAAA